LNQLQIESIAAQSPKFTAPIVLIHGLWCRASMWRPFMGYLAHRGWTCSAPHLRGHAGAEDTVDIREVGLRDYVRDVERVIAASGAPPVVIGHDIGGLLALQCAARGTRAVVALAPVVPRSIARTSHPALSGLAARLARLRMRPILPPRGRVGAAFFAGGPPGGMTPESPVIGSELGEAGFSVSPCSGVPTLVIAGEHDPFCPPSAVQQLARSLGAAFLTAEGATHSMPWGFGWEKRVADTHRWLIQSLGEPLLAWSGDEEE